MKKKIIFILVGVIALAALIVIFWTVRNKSKEQGGTPSTPSPSTLPTRAEKSEQNIQTVQKDIKSILAAAPSQTAVKEGVDSVDFKSADNSVVPLSDFEKATKVKIIPDLRRYLGGKDYAMYYCPIGGSKKEYAVYFGYNVEKAYANLNPDTFTWMKNWEKNMLQDLHPVLFPGADFNQGDLNQNLQFRDGKFRYAEIKLPDGGASSINYYVSLNGVIITTSVSCMEKLINIYEPLQP